MRFSAIPTEYGGASFRSRLEARWAAFFDLEGRAWQYEPFDLEGYIPDFLVDVAGVPVLVEVKPALSRADEVLLGAAERLASTWDGHGMVVGINPDVAAWVRAKDKRVVTGGWCNEYGGLWRTAGSLTQWRGHR